MKNLFYSMLFISTTAFVACSDSSNSHDSHDNDGHNHSVSNEDIPVIKVEMKTDSMFQEHVDAIAHLYSHIQTGLANDDAEEASLRAKQLVNHMHEYDTIIFAENEQEIYRKYKARIMKLSKAIQSTEDIVVQRKQFENMSDVIYQLVKTVGTSELLYKSYCPMAFEGKGAMWLSETAEIANPYFGKEMYSCGSAEEVIKK